MVELAEQAEMIASFAKVKKRIDAGRTLPRWKLDRWEEVQNHRKKK